MIVKSQRDHKGLRPSVILDVSYIQLLLSLLKKITATCKPVNLS